MGAVAVVHDALVILKDHGPDVDMSAKFTVIEYKDTFPQSVRLTLNARKGRFLTLDPKIVKRDRIYVRIIEKGGKVTEDVFHVRKIKRKRIPGVGLGLELICPHQSEHLWKRTISFKGRGKRISGNRALELVVGDINANKGASDPTIEIPVFDPVTKVGNRFDTNTSNSYVFESTKAETAIEEIKDIEAQPVEGGGSLEPMYVRYKSKYDHASGMFLDTVELQAFEQGFRNNGGIFNNIPTVTLQHSGGSSPRPSILRMESDEDPEEGTNLVAIGNKTTGSYPREWMLYFGAKEVFDSARAYDNTATYKRGNLVVGPNGGTFESKQGSTGISPPNGTFWEPRFFFKPSVWSGAISYFSDAVIRRNDIAYKSLSGGNLNNDPETNPLLWRRVHFAPTVDYSPLTKDKAQFFINALAGARHATTNNFKTSMIDPNVVIDDALHPRMPVRLVTNDPTNIPIDHKLDGSSRIPDAYMILVINPVTGVEEGFGDFAGSDASGVPFAGNVAEYIDRDLDGTGFWRVFKGKQTQQDQEIFDWEETDSWVKFPCVPVFTGPIPSQYVDPNGDCVTFPISGVGTREIIWVKGAYTLSELLGVGKVGVFRVGRQFECVHSVKFDTTNSRIDAGNEEIIDENESATSAFFVKSQPRALDGSFNTFYVGLNFWSLHPLTSNSLPYGVVTIGEKIKLPTMDLNNMDLTHLGLSEWFGPGVEDYYPLQALIMWMRLSIQDLFLGFLDDLDADFVIGTFWVDRQMNVMLVEEPIQRNNKTLGYTANLNKMKPFQGVPGTSAFGIQADNPSGVVAFDPTEFLFGGIYTRDSFDKQGRYIGLRSRFLNKDTMKMSVDAFRYSKPLVATNVDQPGNKPAFNIEPMKFQKTSISVYSQLKNFLLGIQQFINFDRRKFTLDVPPGRNIDWGDPVYVTDTQAIDDADDAVPNTVKLTADAITITVSKTKDGPAGITKKVELVRRLYV